MSQASMLEIYNEEYKDLLGKALPSGKKHQVGGCTELSRHAHIKHGIGIILASSGRRQLWASALNFDRHSPVHIHLRPACSEKKRYEQVDTTPYLPYC